MATCTLVTGAASGIGQAVCQLLLAHGEEIVAADLSAETLSASFGKNPHVLCVAGDLTTADGFANLTNALKSRFEAVKGFVHCAGFDCARPLGFIADETVHKLVAVHAGFPIQFLGWLAKKGNHAESCSCVCISSLSAHEGAKGHVAYAAAKGAVEGFLKPAAAELLPKGIRLNALVLGVVQTEMAMTWMNKLTPDQLSDLQKDYPLGLGLPVDIAHVIAFLLGAESRWITGQTLICDGGHSLT